MASKSEKIPRRALNAELRKYVGCYIDEEHKALLETVPPIDQYRRLEQLCLLGFLAKGRLDGKYRYFNLTEKGKQWLLPVEMKTRMF
jgi:hypothetical protein